ncbi:hypothetical protein WA1_29555 [Scytonema hofmannii PCC 7110]|uniref:Uncharacterized protein n=1 Tax=Scytonema hofmannii PCC 7110 TaxID=128403 RepID=A0A139X5X5_9CYAN|nr:hypothetical protein WA1_29555 [Scytonema hofmannii PCC 7110]
MQKLKAKKDDAIAADWLNITLEFVEPARRDLSYKAFVAEVEDAVLVYNRSFCYRQGLFYQKMMRWIILYPFGLVFCL